MQLMTQPGPQAWQAPKQAPVGYATREELRMTVATGLANALVAGVKSKAAVAVLTTLLAAGAVGGGTAAAAANGAFGQQVKAKVAACKAALAQGTHGIGECVSDFAQQHGPQERQQHSQGNGPNNSQNTHGNSGNHGGPPSGTPGASNSDSHGKP